MTTLTAPTTASAFPSFGSLLATRTVVEVKSFVRDKDQLIWVLAFPLGMFVLFATIFGGGETITSQSDPAQTATIAQVMLPGMLAYGVFLSGFQNLATAIAYEREKGHLKRLRATPLTPVAYFSGKIAQVLIVSVVQAALLLALAALAFDVPLPADPGSWLTFASAYLLGIGAGTVLGIAFSSLPKTAKAAGNIASGIATVLAFISGVFIVSTAFPTWLMRVAEVFPLYWISAGMRSALLPDWIYSTFTFASDGQPRPLLGAVVLGVWFVVGLVTCVRTFRWVAKK